MYALRTIGNTLIYRATGARWAGDTIRESIAGLSREYRRAGLRITRLTPSPGFLGMPVFVYLRLVATHAPPAWQGPVERHAA